MKSNYKKIGIIFSLLFILLISLAMVSAEEIASDSDDLTLSDDVEKLKNPEYAARYAREKYLFTKDGEIVIKLPDE